ncbi:MAG: indolepyruvate oxidoreductase subunit beta, partial [Candidatus Bathyarchaeota archaeon]|nr:indolepyruvate oxidoreductase subunit beta [Candidatus Bathyarchaeota archaeon]
MVVNIVFSGIGGQGIVVASDIFCEAALIDGWDVAKAEVHGMAQRGGSIVAHVRVGEKVQAPLIETGTAEIILGFEMLEAARVLPMLSKNGTVIVNTKYIPPSTSGSSTLTHEQILNLIRERAKTVYEIDGLGIATKLGNILVVNTVLLGALSAIPENIVKKSSLEKAVANRLKQKYIDVNLKALQIGKETVKLG